MTGLVEEGEEVMAEGKKKDDAPADLALSARRSGSSTTRSPATRRREISPSSCSRPDIVQLLTLSLGEEENADQLLDQMARPLMSVARMPARVE